MCTVCSNYLYVITEFCELGDLHSFVFKNKGNYLDETVENKSQISKDGYLLSNSSRQCAEDFYRVTFPSYPIELKFIINYMILAVFFS